MFEARRFVEKSSGFIRRETQVGGAQFGHLAARAAGPWDGRILSGRDNQTGCGGR